MSFLMILPIRGTTAATKNTHRYVENIGI